MNVKLLLATMVVAVGCSVCCETSGAAEANDTGLADLFQLVATGAFTNGESVLSGWDTNGLGQVQMLLGTNFFGASTNMVTPFSWSTNLTPFVWNTNAVVDSSSRKLLSPGVYLSKPYSCLVIVPGRSGDSQMVIEPKGEIASKMPMIEPKVEFVPWPEAKPKVSSK